MSWLVRIENNKLEVWSDLEYSHMKDKCEYYGAKPHWEEVRHLESAQGNAKTTKNAEKKKHHTDAALS